MLRQSPTGWRACDPLRQRINLLARKRFGTLLGRRRGKRALVDSYQSAAARRDYANAAACRLRGFLSKAIVSRNSLSRIFLSWSHVATSWKWSLRPNAPWSMYQLFICRMIVIRPVGPLNKGPAIFFRTPRRRYLARASCPYLSFGYRN